MSLSQRSRSQLKKTSTKTSARYKGVIHVIINSSFAHLKTDGSMLSHLETDDYFVKVTPFMVLYIFVISSLLKPRCSISSDDKDTSSCVGVMFVI